MARQLPIPSVERKKIEVEHMKLEISCLAALLYVGTDLLARAAVQGVEQALLTTAFEQGLSGIRRGSRQLRHILNFRS